MVSQLESWLDEVRTLHGDLLLAPATDGELDNEVNLAGKLHPERSNMVDFRIKRNQIRSLTRALHDVLWKFNEEEEIYKERCRKKITDYLRIQDISLTDEEISDAIDNGDIFERTKGILLAYNDRKALFEDVKLRRDELFEIEKVIRELGEMFLDLNNLVLSQAIFECQEAVSLQGEMMDRIDANIEDAVDLADKAKQNVKSAHELQRKARKMSASSSKIDTKVYGGCEGPDAPYVKLVSSDGHQFYIKK
uniref:t-SNARE coiled-coil homology domain-containing protein n=1 Tax=Angiostrongylus cantonensis TaxID=6313 RepID=A0A0K0D6U5_ANGCA